MRLTVTHFPIGVHIISWSMIASMFSLGILGDMVRSRRKDGRRNRGRQDRLGYIVCQMRKMALGDVQVKPHARVPDAGKSIRT